MIENMMQNDLPSRFYTPSSGLAACSRYFADLMRQISHKYPRSKTLEIRAGTGDTTLSTLDAIGDAYSSYTCTDISASFFSRLEGKLPRRHTPKVDFKVFNVENTPGSEGFEENSYDVVIAANVLHATKYVSETIRISRALLRPGGYLIEIEVTGNTMHTTGLMGALEGWWLGANEGTRMGPGISVKEWDDLLQQQGFRA